MKSFRTLVATVVVVSTLHFVSAVRGESGVEGAEKPAAGDAALEDAIPAATDDGKFSVKKDQPKAIEEEHQEKVSYEGHQLWKVNLNSGKGYEVVTKLKNEDDISTWGGNRTSVDIMIKPKNLHKVQEELVKNNISYKILQENVQNAIDTENPLEDLSALENREGHRMSFDSYHRLNDINGYLDYLASTYSSLCKIYVIGSSVYGRPLKVLRISNGNANNKAIWVDAGMHAREWISPATVSYVINHFVMHFRSESEAIKNIDWYFLPVGNPDGYEFSHTVDRLWRKNRARSGRCAGTDLNRNYGYQWGGKGAGRNPCQETYGGTGPFSEPETAAIRNFIQNTGANWKASVSFHSYGQYILYPWGYDRLVPPDHLDLQRVAESASQAMQQATGSYYRIGPAAKTLYPASGGSDDWAKGAMNIKYTYTIELRDSGYHGFLLPAAYIQPSGKEGLAALKVIGEAAAAA